MGNEWSRRCIQCDENFRTDSQSRKRCFVCTPPRSSRQRKNLPRKSKKASTDGKLSRSVSGMSEQETGIEAVIAQAEDLEYRSRLNPGSWRLGTNRLGDRVVTINRPELGWGRCQSVDPVYFRSTCQKEKMHVSVSFGWDHVREWKAVYEKRQARAVAEVFGRPDLERSAYRIRKIADATAVMADIAGRVSRGVLPQEKADAILSIINQQVKVLREVRRDQKLQADIDLARAKAEKARGSVSGSSGKREEEDEGALSEEEEKELRELDERTRRREQDRSGNYSDYEEVEVTEEDLDSESEEE